MELKFTIDEKKPFQRQVLKQLFVQVLEMNKGNRTNTAKQLGLSLRTVKYKIDEYELDKYIEKKKPPGYYRMLRLYPPE